MVNSGFMSCVNGDSAFQVLITLSLPAANASHAQPLPNWVVCVEQYGQSRITHINIMCVSQIRLWRRFGDPQILLRRKTIYFDASKARRR